MLLVAKSIKPHGIKGEIKVEYYLDDLNSFLQLEKVIIDKNSYEVERIKNFQKPPYAIVKLVGIDNMDMAETLRNKKLYSKREDMPVPEKGHYYIDDLIGCQVLCDGDVLGILKEILQNGSADVYVVKTKKGEILFPYVGEVIKNVDVDHKIIVLNKEELDKVAVYEN